MSWVKFTSSKKSCFLPHKACYFHKLYLSESSLFFWCFLKFSVQLSYKMISYKSNNMFDVIANQPPATSITDTVPGWMSDQTPVCSSYKSIAKESWVQTKKIVFIFRCTSVLKPPSFWRYSLLFYFVFLSLRPSSF